MHLEDFKAHLRMIAGEDPKAEIAGAARPHPSLVCNRRKAVRAPKKTEALIEPLARHSICLIT
jgi:hypothetical protein